MGRSSRLFVLICIIAATPAFGQGRGVMMRMSTNVGARMPMQRMPMQMAKPDARPLVMQRATSAVRVTSGRGSVVARRNGFGFYGAGLGLSLASDLATPQIVVREHPPEAEVMSGIAPPPCIRPRIIKIGLGLRHVARTRVIYGQPLACVP